VHISPLAKLGKNVRVGDQTVIYDNVVIGDDSVIANNCVIGEPTSSYYERDNYQNEPTFIGSNALIRSHTIVYAGCVIGNGISTGHRVTLRENTTIGNHCKIGTNSDLQGFLELGDYCQLHSNVHLCQFSKLGNYVFIYPNTVFANDTHPPTEFVKGPTIGDFTQIGVQSSLIGDITIGEHCLIAARSMVVKSFDDFSLLIGTPAARKTDVRELKDEHEKPLYPWKNRFSRGMPWMND